MIVAIDGPAGAGKSSVSAAVAERLGFQLIDTGALYRCVALRAFERGVSLEDEAGLEAIAAGLTVRFAFQNGRNRVLLEGVDVSGDIRSQEISDGASRVSALARVRAALLELQRTMGREQNSVMEGRDIGTVVFPDAEVKVYLTAALDVRGSRRVADYAASGRMAELDEVMADIEERDRRDMERETAPLRQADDAVEVDTTGMSFDEVVALLVSLVRG